VKVQTSLTISALLTSIFVSFLLQACAGYSASGGPAPLVKEPLSYEVSEKFKPASVRSVAVMLLSNGVSAQLDASLRRELTDELIDLLDLQTSLEVVNTAAPAETVRAMDAVSAMREAERKKAVEFGKRLAVDAVLFGVIERYNEATGGRFGSNDPASVNFTLWLLNPQTSDVLWTAVYDKRERPLSENLFRLPQEMKSGVGYESSAKLIKTGFSQAVSALERLREQTAE